MKIWLYPFRTFGLCDFLVTHDGVSVSYDQELLCDIWHAFQRGYKRRIGRFKNNFMAGMFPANTITISIVIGALSLFSTFHRDLSFGILPFIEYHILYFFFGDGIIGFCFSLLISGALIWFVLVQVLRITLKFLLSYKGWMYEQPGKPISTLTKLWLGFLNVMSKSGPMLHSYQGALPHLPLPSLDETVAKHLVSMRPILNDEEFAELEHLSEVFRKGVGRRLQRYLSLKSWLSTNYVTDWWEEFVYLRQRSPIMINSNYYGFDTLNEHPTNNQGARAANVTYSALQFRRQVERQEVTPFSISPRTKVPFCTMQYERLFNSCRIPGEECDKFFHWDDARHVAVYSRGCWFKVIVHNGKRYLNACELQIQYDSILSQELVPSRGEDKLAALTAGERTHWAETRRAFFRSGINRTSLNDIERAAFVVILDDEEVSYDKDDSSKLDRWAHILLHGKGYNRWFDKSFNIIISKNAHVGINTEHSWGDAAVTAHFMEWMLLRDIVFIGYDENGNTKGIPTLHLKPERIKWDIPEPALNAIEISLKVAQDLIDDVEMALLVWTEYGKGFIKKLGVSPDAFLQMCLQYTYYKNQNKFSLTYEASMTRLYREGRTETVRSCTMKSVKFVLSMLDPAKKREERLALLKEACDNHQELYRDAMCGKGIDRHLFALYVIKRYLEEESPFFDRFFPPTYLLSTSQTPMNQVESDMYNMDPAQRMRLTTAGGGFGPVADRGYGVSYIVAGENQISFHISSKRSADNTSSKEFREELKRSLKDMQALFLGKEDEVAMSNGLVVSNGL
ncbi:Choline/Carnitine O-acyltransferase [Dictyocaulus viviparus]|uniref:carnitine O-palmitoyltransferase n=1 Tax=Dictyocaulus viviparus TaxID=29172 RepID=A0A0D8Y5G8_DICVI|nr:Choline/Carnitine O-acyltransferase [Dictyocaulus viviparus]